MPHFRGIDIGVVVGRMNGMLKEYSHPDSSSVHLKKAGADDKRNEGALDADPTRQKVNPRVSVYITSLPGEQFWLRYAVTQDPPPSKYLYFKVFMNGHQVASWGINPSRNPLGSLSRALYRPGDRWRDQYGDVNMDHVGIEARYFSFMLGLDDRSVAEDGGTIEVQVYRASKQRRVAPELREYRSQERYGIASPSGGLIDNPQDATYFQYNLIDQKGCPYCTFRFHYRSMKHLQQLSLIPEEETTVFAPKQRSRPRGEESSEHISPSFQQFAFGVGSPHTRVFDSDMGSVGSTNPEPSDLPDAEEDIALKNHPKLLPLVPSNGPIPEPCKFSKEETMDDILQRPLPELPPTRPRQSSTSSLRSNCPSLTPSLVQYVDSDDFDNEQIEIDMAQPVLIPSESMQALELENGNESKLSNLSLSDYADSHDSTGASHSPEHPSPDAYLPTTGSVLERHLEGFESPIAQSSPPRSRVRLRSFTSENTYSGEESHSQADTLSLTEAEWLRHSPSPLRRRSGCVERLWSPRPDKRSSDSSSNNSGHKENAFEAFHNANSRSFRDNVVHANVIRDPPEGNWI